MRDRSAALAAARATIDSMPQYRGMDDAAPYQGMNQGGYPPPPQQQQFAPGQNPIMAAIMNSAQQQQQPQGTQFAPPPMDDQSFMLMKIYHLLSGLSYEVYGDPNKWQENYVEAFFEQIKTLIKRGKSTNPSKMKAIFPRKS